jgi:hypothetical protein
MALKSKVNFTCNICNIGFKTEYLYNKHKNKKTPCIEEYEVYLNEEISKVENIIKEKDKCMNRINEIKCSYCKIEYTRKYTLKNHIANLCKQRKVYENELQQYSNELTRITQIKNIHNLDIDDREELKKLSKDEIINLLYEQNKTTNLNKSTNPNNTNNQQTAQIINNNINGNQQNIENQQNIMNQNITNINITLNNYDEPNCDFLTLEQKNKFLKDRYKGLIDFITYVYFNKSYPENHTILYTNLRSKFGHIYKNNKWIAEEIDMIADQLNGYSFDKLSEHIDEIKGDKDKAIKYEKEIEKGDKFVEYYTSNDATKQSRTNIKKLIYNNKDIIENTIKKYKKVNKT